MTPDQLNNDLASRLGCSPLGFAGLYRWMHSENWFHLMKTDKTEVVPRGLLFAVEPVYIHRKMVELEDTWLLAHWHDSMSERQWVAEHGTKLLWPREGYYSPTNIVLSAGEAPTQTSNDQAVYLIRKQDEKTFADLAGDGERIENLKERRETSKISDRIDDSVSAFCNIPGSRSGHVSFGGV
jgi:hypothetical protein